MNEQVFTTFPRLETERLVLREVTLDDAPALFRVHGDPEVARYFGRPPMASLEASREKIEALTLSFQRAEGIRWGLTLKGTDEVVGSLGHWRLQRAHERSEVGYELRPDHWRRGLMREGMRAILRFGFEELGLHSVEAQVDPDNAASAGLLASLGFRLEGRLRENFRVEGTAGMPGRFTGTLVFGLLQGEATGP